MMDVLDFSKIKLVAMDMDGTALNSNHVLSPRTIAAVKAVYSKGIKVIFCYRQNVECGNEASAGS